jgi:hypothetical protein
MKLQLIINCVRKEITSDQCCPVADYSLRIHVIICYICMVYNMLNILLIVINCNCNIYYMYLHCIYCVQYAFYCLCGYVCAVECYLCDVSYCSTTATG